MNSNLPPGVSVGDIPGNRPEDAEWDAVIDWICGETQISAKALQALVFGWCDRNNKPPRKPPPLWGGNQ